MMIDRSKAMKLGRPGWFWHIGMAAFAVLSASGVLLVVNPLPSTRGDGSGRGPFPFGEWIVWIVAVGICIGFTLYGFARLWRQWTLRFTDEGVSQSKFPGWRVHVMWDEVVRVVRPGAVSQVEIHSPSGQIRITQDAYRDPDALFRLLAERVPRDAEGWERLKAPTP